MLKDHTKSLRIGSFCDDCFSSLFFFVSVEISIELIFIKNSIKLLLIMQGQFYTAETALLAKAFHRLCITLFVAPPHLIRCIALHQKSINESIHSNDKE